MEITFIDETKKVSKNEREDIDSLLQYAADYLKLPENSEMSITFMDNERIQVINRDYRG
ncbi:MAG: rRNA maturation RNAse YbeY, partial [Tetragenococcus halophilus]|nr:rRNA maturation RNAse YbeY [Tetragenococcus halophilus]MDN6728102.1 rRNA maturation RNAse YbeY [Tetragenococcus halophilus]